MAHPKRTEWENQLADLLEAVDVELEECYGEDYPLHPARTPHGATANPKYSGLFQVSAQFTAGFGSEHGRGYVVEVRMVTLNRVAEETRRAIEDEAAARIGARLADTFPGRKLTVERDGPVYKIVGDLSLGDV